MKKAFTLIELLVVIAIIAILAAILFPVFAQAKLAAKKTADLSNIKQNITATFIYSNDADDSIPNSLKYESYVLFTRLLPYTKSKDLFKIPAGTVPQGTTQKKQHDNGIDDYMTPPDDACNGLGVSKVGTAKWYNDVIPPNDYFVNYCLFGYANGCGGKNNSYEPAPNTVSGSPGGLGVEGVGPGSLTFTSPAKVVLYANYPMHGDFWPGGSGVGFWGSNFKGYWTQGDNVAHMDGHAQYYKIDKLLPGQSYNDEGTGPYGPDWNSGNPRRGTSFQWWGTSYAAPDFQ